MERLVPRIETLEHTSNYGKFVVEPLERGYGVTLGNSVRRVLLSSLPGVAMTPIRKGNVALEATRVGPRSDFERLTMEIWTNDTIQPGDALSRAAQILDDYVRLFFEVSETKVVRQEAQPGLMGAGEAKPWD